MNSLPAFGCRAPRLSPIACSVSLTGLSGTHFTGAPMAALTAACVLFISRPIAYSPPMTRSSTARMAIGNGTMSCFEVVPERSGADISGARGALMECGESGLHGRRTDDYWLGQRDPQ